MWQERSSCLLYFTLLACLTLLQTASTACLWRRLSTRKCSYFTFFTYVTADCFNCLPVAAIIDEKMLLLYFLYLRYCRLLQLPACGGDYRRENLLHARGALAWPQLYGAGLLTCFTCLLYLLYLLFAYVALAWPQLYGTSYMYICIYNIIYIYI
jgi:hypothetical protein